MFDPLTATVEKLIDSAAAGGYSLPPALLQARTTRQRAEELAAPVPPVVTATDVAASVLEDLGAGKPVDLTAHAKRCTRPSRTPCSPGPPTNC